MESNFFRSNKNFWSFSLDKKGKLKDSIRIIKGPSVKTLIDYAFEHNMEINFLPNLSTPCIFIKARGAVWHYVNSEEEAQNFPKNIELSKNYPCC